MTHDEIISMAHEAGTTFVTNQGVTSATLEWLERFAQLVAARSKLIIDTERKQSMTDEKLLHLAASASGLVPVGWTDDGKSLLLNGIQAPWNPLSSDADAFRLATDLGLNVYHINDACYALQSEDEDEENFVHYNEYQDKYQATRRAITIAAANIAE